MFMLLEAKRWIEKELPFWNRTQGADHIWYSNLAPYSNRMVCKWFQGMHESGTSYKNTCICSMATLLLAASLFTLWTEAFKRGCEKIT